jgi:hypothetical protein
MSEECFVVLRDKRKGPTEILAVCANYVRANQIAQEFTRSWDTVDRQTLGSLVQYSDGGFEQSISVIAKDFDTSPAAAAVSV